MKYPQWHDLYEEATELYAEECSVEVLPLKKEHPILLRFYADGADAVNVAHQCVNAYIARREHIEHLDYIGYGVVA